MPKIAMNIDMNNKVDKNVATAEVLDFFCFNILGYSSYIFMQNILLKIYIFYSSQIHHIQKCIRANNLILHVVMSYMYIIDINVNIVI